MKLRTAIVAASGAALIGTGALALPAAMASPASPASATHKLSFISDSGKSVMFGKAAGGEQDIDVSKTGKGAKTVGFDMLHFASTGVVNITVDAAGGFLYGTAVFNFKTGAISHGKVTGGTGAFKGATGTLKAKNLNKAGTVTAVTITYRT